jgi:DNA gyrase subunit A
MGSVVLNQLYAHTQLESSYGYTMLVVDHNRPRIMNLVQVLQAYIDHRMEVVTRRTVFELCKAEARAHILEGLLKALDNIDEVVKIIRASRTRQDAADSLIARFEFSPIQAGAILEMRLHQLTGLAREDVEGELAELKKQIEYYKALLASREMRLGVIKEELEEVRDKYTTERRTEITMDDSDLNVADLIARHSCVITVSNTGYIKRTPSATYRTQHRGGKGIIGMETKDEDYVEHLFNADSHDLIFFFTDKGFMHWLNVYEIPEGSRVSKGKAIVNMIKIEPGEKIKAMLTIRKEEFEDENKFIIMCARSGYIKKTSLGAFKNLRRAGLRALRIEDDDDLIGAAVCENGNEIILSTRMGMACRFDQNDSQLRPMGRTARGVTGMRFKIDGDSIVSMEVIRENLGDVEEGVSDEEAGGPELLVVSENGMGKRSYVKPYRKTNRGAKGVTSIKLREGDLVLDALQVTAGDELMLTTERGQLVRIPIDEIRTIGRASQGVRIMNLNSDDRITGVSKIVKVEEEEEAAAVAENAENAAGAENSSAEGSEGAVNPETSAENTAEADSDVAENPEDNE